MTWTVHAENAVGDVIEETVPDEVTALERMYALGDVLDDGYMPSCYPTEAR